ncbi:hypothetical protein PVK06_039359 [Gossypium arboreum]|uniref:CCHC-type domain-containing protein n=1 Tax=Gossypium arboreum TaxID=29729 RepID=A0ABR0N2X1_GOSAR|nr:hypothetical protein PVK06_039359 [Gossypium arboreum]
MINSATDVGRSTNKVKCKTDESLDLDDLVVNEKGISVDGVGTQRVSWKEKLMGSAPVGANVQQEEDFKLEDGDAKAVIMDGVPSITFFDRIRLPGMPEGMYTKSLLRFIGNAIRTIAKIDRNTDSTFGGQFARLVVFIDLGKPLVSKVKIDGKFQCVKYESLPLVCFECARFGHKSDLCPHGPRVTEMPEGISKSGGGKDIFMKKRVEGEKFGSWMIVELRQR